MERATPYPIGVPMWTVTYTHAITGSKIHTRSFATWLDMMTFVGQPMITVIHHS